MIKCIIKDNAPKEWSDVIKIKQYERQIVDVNLDDFEVWEGAWDNSRNYAYLCTFSDGKQMRIRDCCLEKYKTPEELKKEEMTYRRIFLNTTFEQLRITDITNCDTKEEFPVALHIDKETMQKFIADNEKKIKDFIINLMMEHDGRFVFDYIKETTGKDATEFSLD